MNYLIFRTDRIGDFLLIRTILKAIKDKSDKNKIFIVASKSNYEFIKKTNLVDKVFLYSDGIKNRLILLKELRKLKIDNIIISDKKNRSIFFSLLLKSQNKIYNTSRSYLFYLLKLFNKHVFLDNDKLINKDLYLLLKENLTTLGIDLNRSHNRLFPKDFFEKYYELGNLPKLNENTYITIHLDEKWELTNYSKSFKKALNMTDILPKLSEFENFLRSVIEKTGSNIIITTGIIKTKIIEDLKSNMDKKENFYEKKLENNSCILIDNLDFFSTSEIISKSKLLITCHGAFLHIAANYEVNVIDIFEKSKRNHYLKLTNNINNYKYLYREKFQLLSKNIINCLV